MALQRQTPFGSGSETPYPSIIRFFRCLSRSSPVFAFLAICCLAAGSRSSRARIRLLERDAASPGSAEKLAHVLARLEQQIPTNPLAKCDRRPKTTPASRKHSVVLRQTSTLPLKKELAFLPDLRNAHGTIVCRDLDVFDFDRQGEGIVRHWASVFVL
ncbi:hypothetical protein GGX14DRAFT_694046 [Mycena pura]|uniref:Uncharacterized protein n=1 Tax=Mycena pura TaxID=153505 RepID=A0AAD6YMX9_9AGAR|nr:hypothetical protein GGX14DRAFT_694046 [Mycena pura]